MLWDKLKKISGAYKQCMAGSLTLAKKFACNVQH